MSRILLTGASGVVGHALLMRLREKHEVLALSRSALPGTVQADIHALDERMIREFSPETVIHAAWEGSDGVMRNDPELLAKNAASSMKLLEMAANAGAKRWISFGSQAEYSPNLEMPIAETAPAEPQVEYGKTKLALGQKQLSFAHAHGMQAYWLRLFSCYSERQKPPFVIPYLLECKRRGEQPVIGTPNAVQDFIHADDVALAVEHVLAGDVASGAYNVATGQGTSIGEIAELLGFKLPSSDTAATYRVADITKFTSVTGWKPAISLKDGLAACL